MTEQLEARLQAWADNDESYGHHARASCGSEAADTLKRYREALEYYAGEHPLPNEGPWGAQSTDFGQVAQKALLALFDS